METDRYWRRRPLQSHDRFEIFPLDRMKKACAGISISTLNTHRKTIECRQHLDDQFDLAQINELFQKSDLLVAFGFVDIDIPGFWAPLIARTPAIAAFLQLILEIEWGLLGPDPYGLAARVFEQQRQRGAIDLRKRVGQNFQKRVAVIDGAVRAMKHADAAQQIAVAEIAVIQIDTPDRSEQNEKMKGSLILLNLFK
jgi:hypothetical protein